MDLALDEVKRFLGLDLDDSDQDGLIDSLILTAIAEVEQIAGVYLGTPAATTSPVLMNGTGSRALQLAQLPAASPAPIIERETRPGTWEVVTVSDYQVIGRELRHNSGWHFGVGNYRATYTRGYANGSTDPFFLRARQAVLDMIQMMFVGRDTAGMQSETIGEYSYTRASASDPQASLPDSLRRLRGLVYS